MRRPRKDNRPGLSVGVIDALKQQGLNQSDIARLFGVSRQAVSWHKQTYNGRLTPREQVLREHWPFDCIYGQGEASPARRLRDHAEWFVVGEDGITADNMRRLRSFWKRLRDKGLVVEYDPALPPTPGLSKLGGWAYRPREPRDGDLMIRVNEHTRLTAEGRRIFRLPD
ncbi:hypothetical protein SEA_SAMSCHEPPERS_83 [Mycobacterium phage SamScheppers]|nr:hypothetical protein SEA_SAMSCHEPPERS_83 [Mycobacterium phage SamScheppers]